MKNFTCDELVCHHQGHDGLFVCNPFTAATVTLPRKCFPWEDRGDVIHLQSYFWFLAAVVSS